MSGISKHPGFTVSGVCVCQSLLCVSPSGHRDGQTWAFCPHGEHSLKGETMTLMKGYTDVCSIPAWQQGEAGDRVSWCKILGKVPCGSECGYPWMEEVKALAGPVMGRIMVRLGEVHRVQPRKLCAVTPRFP